MIFKRTLKIVPFSRIDKVSILGGDNYIGRHSIIRCSSIGCHSYVGSNCIFTNATIGKYCSISSNVQVVSGNHPSSVFVSTHPAFYSAEHSAGKTFVKQTIFKEFTYTTNGKNVEIGNDVWIGRNVLIMAGVTIGDGAIIATGSVITKDVAPYAIVGGVPAKHIRQRFNTIECDKLLQIQWWNWSEEEIRHKVMLFSNVDIFLENIENGSK